MVLIAEIFLIFYTFKVSSQSENLVATIGMIILVAGIQLGLESLSDITKMSKKEIEKYQERKNIKTQSKYRTIRYNIFSDNKFAIFSLKFTKSEGNSNKWQSFCINFLKYLDISSKFTLQTLPFI